MKLEIINLSKKARLRMTSIEYSLLKGMKLARRRGTVRTFGKQEGTSEEE
jgi:hypothetical protein